MGSDSLEVAMGEMALTPQVVGQKTKLGVNVLSSIAQRLRSRWRRLSVRVLLLIPFPIGMRVIRRLGKSRLLQRTLFRRRLQGLRPIVELADPPADVDAASCRFLIANALFPAVYQWRKLAAARGNWDAVRAWFDVQGIEKLDEAKGRGKGVILVCQHCGGAGLVPIVLARMGRSRLSAR